MRNTIERKPVNLSHVVKADTTGSFPSEIEIFRAGEWHTPWHGDFIITVADIDQAIEQFNAGVYRVQGTEPLPITLDHNGGESPAAARIDRVYRIDDRFMASVSWTALGKEKLERDEYRYVSFEFCPRSMPFENPESAGDMWVNVLTGATLTNDPLFKKLKPVMASVKGGGDNSKEGEDMNLSEIRVKDLKDLTDEEKTFLAEHQSELTAEERTKFEIVDEDAEAKAKADAEAKAKADQEAADKAAAEKAAAEKAEQEKLEASTKGMTKEQRAEFVSLKASVAKLQAQAEAGERAEKELLKTKLTASVKEHIARGAIKSDQLDSTVEMLMASTEAVRETQLGFIANLPTNQILAAEAGKSGQVDTNIELTTEELELAESFGNDPEKIKEFKKAQAQA